MITHIHNIHFFSFSKFCFCEPGENKPTQKVTTHSLQAEKQLKTTPMIRQGNQYLLVLQIT